MHICKMMIILRQYNSQQLPLLVVRTNMMMRRQQRQQQYHQLLRLNLHLQRSNRQQRRFYYYNSCSSSISSSSNIKSSSSSGRNNVTTTSPLSQSQSQLPSSRSLSLSFSLWTNTTIQDAAHVIVNTKNSNNKSSMSSNNNNTRIRSNYRYNSNNNNGTISEMITVRSRKEEEKEKEDDEGDADDENEDNIETATFLTVVERHSIEDTIISVHVSDKIFKTLKSTLQYSPILWKTMLRSEQQQQNKSDILDSIFIDRDPKHFPTILAYLRNEADGISYNSSNANDVSCPSSNGGSTACTASALDKIKGKYLATKDKSNSVYTKYVRLPSGGDATELEELFIEAKHYQLDDLQQQLTHCTFTLQALSFLRGSGSGGSNNNNPFNGLKDIIQTIRTTTLMVVGTGTTIGGINWATSFSETKNTILMSLFGG